MFKKSVIFAKIIKHIMIFWNNDTEIQFFTEALKSFATTEQLFYHYQKQHKYGKETF